MRDEEKHEKFGTLSWKFDGTRHWAYEIVGKGPYQCEIVSFGQKSTQVKSKQCLPQLQEGLIGI